MYIEKRGEGDQNCFLLQIPLNDLQQSVNFLLRDKFLYFPKGVLFEKGGLG
jgi:hypothetical protein